MAILLESMVFLMKAIESAEEGDDEDEVKVQKRDVANITAAVADSKVLLDAIEGSDLRRCTLKRFS